MMNSFHFLWMFINSVCVLYNSIYNSNGELIQSSLYSNFITGNVFDVIKYNNNNNNNNKINFNNPGFQVDFMTKQNDLESYHVKPNELSKFKDIPIYHVEPPELMYTSKGQPAIIHCVAEPVILLHIVCATSFISQSNRYKYELNLIGLQNQSNGNINLPFKFDHQNYPKKQNVVYEKLSRRRQCQSVTRVINVNTVEEWFGDFWCRCEAWNNILELGEPRVRYSQKVHIQIAYLDKRFIKQPESARIPLGWTVEFLCEPPDGRPLPKLSWLKNGSPLELYSNHTIGSRVYVSNSRVTWNREVNEKVAPYEKNKTVLQSRLVIHNTRLDDEASYTCVAENQAGRRTSLTVQLTIHTDGHWSSWSEWKHCPKECIPTKDQSVEGKLSDKNQCPSICGQFRGERTRDCNSPKPHGGGRFCLGERSEKLDCSDVCQGNATLQFSKSDRSKVATLQEFGLLVVLGLAILFFLLAAISVILIFWQKYCPSLSWKVITQALHDKCSYKKEHNITHFSYVKPNFELGKIEIHASTLKRDFETQAKPTVTVPSSLHYDSISLTSTLHYATHLNMNFKNPERKIISANKNLPSVNGGILLSCGLEHGTEYWTCDNSCMKNRPEEQFLAPSCTMQLTDGQLSERWRVCNSINKPEIFCHQNDFFTQNKFVYAPEIASENENKRTKMSGQAHLKKNHDNTDLPQQQNFSDNPQVSKHIDIKCSETNK